MEEDDLASDGGAAEEDEEDLLYDPFALEEDSPAALPASSQSPQSASQSPQSQSQVKKCGLQYIAA